MGLGTFELPWWLPRRPGAAAATLALNAGLGLVLFLCFRMPEVLDTNDSVSTLLWLTTAASPPKPPQARRTKTLSSRTSTPRTSVEALAPIEPSAAAMSVAPAGAPIDWWKEGERVVRERTRAAAPPVQDGRIDLHIESSRDAPAHHAGESYRDEYGDAVVWVSEKCYIESAPPLPGTPPVFAAARTTRTVCPGASNAPRGDLFKDVPAYRKYHPDPP